MPGEHDRIAFRVPDLVAIEMMTMRERITSTDDVRHPAERLAEEVGSWIVEHVAISNAEMVEMARAAHHAGVPLGSWIVLTCLSAARLVEMTATDEIPL